MRCFVCCWMLIVVFCFSVDGYNSLGYSTDRLDTQQCNQLYLSTIL